MSFAKELRGSASAPLRIRCPQCDAPAGARCSRPGGMVMYLPHAKRRDAYWEGFPKKLKEEKEKENVHPFDTDLDDSWRGPIKPDESEVANNERVREQYLRNCADEFDQRGRNEVSMKAAKEIASAIRGLLVKSTNTTTRLEILEEAMVRIRNLSDYGDRPCLDCKHFGCIAARALVSCSLLSKKE